MEISDLIKFVGGAIVGGLLTIIGNTLNAKLNFKRDYYKKVIDVRFEAYMNLKNYLLSYDIVVVNDIQEQYYLFFSFGSESYNNVVMKHHQVTSDGFWFTEEISDSLLKLNEIFLWIDEKELRSKNEDELKQEIIFAGIKFHEEIREIKTKIKHFLKNDLDTLHDYKLFFKDKDSEKLLKQINIPKNN